jgi:acyl CoA:acetate/3-ketoacid CoA transferase alpha subunit
MELAFNADFAIVKAWKGDTAGNLILKELQETLILCMSGAAKITVAEVEELVEAERWTQIKFIFLEYSCIFFKVQNMKKE